ncbi:MULTISPECIES: transposase [unclassified Mesorhizobium]|uniref:transposase n=1 Tax=unclassified Mesorhizobium TaxID=325217 RepID=UPI001928FC8A|nr:MULTISPECIES: transposase [unclassified Mesorhizobium]
MTARIARIVVAGLSHHVTQRGNGRARVFLSDGDYTPCRDLLVVHCAAVCVAIRGRCLMPNHVHLIFTPVDSDGLRRALREGAPHYAGIIYARHKSAVTPTKKPAAGRRWQRALISNAVREEVHRIRCAGIASGRSRWPTPRHLPRPN